MKKKIKCPYCGEKILADARKCKHCGEWLYDEENDNNESYENEDSSNSSPLVWKLLIAIIIVIIAYFTMPSEQEQREKVNERLCVLVRKDIKKIVNQEDLFTQFVGNGIMQDKKIVSGIAREKYEILIDNYKICSIITIKEKDTGDSHLCGFAAFGVVLVRI